MLDRGFMSRGRGEGSERGEGWVSVDLGLEVEDLGLLFENETAKCAK